jgi:flagellar hook protein FlgE
MTIGMISSVQGIQNAETQLSQVAQNIAQDPLSPQGDRVSLSDQAVALLQSKNSFEANIAALKAGDEMTQSLLKSL